MAEPDACDRPDEASSAPRPSERDPATQGLEVYIVGGAVRDVLLGLQAGDRDWVVVGATPEEMSRRGFIPVGGDFPVFLHPVTKEEYALARTERKSGRGYKGFTFYTGADVTLEDDLGRRDLTVNAIAQAPDGHLIDPLNGYADLQDRVLRHVGQAFVEDPVRLLRLARFAARFDGFSIAPQTLALARRLVEEGEVDALVPERVWREVAKGMMTGNPGRMFDVLNDAGALVRVLPGLRFDSQVLSDELACAARAGLGLPARYAILCRLSDQPEQIGRHVRAPTECIDYSRLLPLVLSTVLPAAGVKALDGISAGQAQQSLHVGQGVAVQNGVPQRAPKPILQTEQLSQTEQTFQAEHPGLWLDLIERCDALRKPDRFLDLLAAAACVGDVDVAAWRARVDAVRSVDAGAVARAAKGDPAKIKPALRQARLEALQACCATGDRDDRHA
ncbi:tRNA CCA-pyrophosphorylase [Allopusillimonas ginsengisoli]|uniref:tRNA CCA-pyrophosphorylase n=1 Tax=Allopusillimonas ginsengisoli TaxID=453575 RepID=UPI0039C018DE